MKLREKAFNLDYLNKYASQMTVGNGFIGLRGAHEEDYYKQVRGMYVAGLYNRPIGAESSELVNLPDITKFEIKIDGELFSLVTGTVISYQRYLNLATGELVRKVVWCGEAKKPVEIITSRVVSQVEESLLGLRLTIKALEKACNIEVVTGVDGQQTNFGTQQLIEKELRVYENQYLTAEYETTESGIGVALAVALSQSGTLQTKNRQLLASYSSTLSVAEVFSLEKKVAIVTTLQHHQPLAISRQLVADSAVSYATLKKAAATSWQEFWLQQRVIVTSENEIDQLALDFASYHLWIMAPKKDSRFSVGAKGLTGEGYKGHVFWDTEIFVLPYFLHNQPEIARNLLIYRYRNLAGAKEKAAVNSYQGGLFPWESALSGKEETPKFAAINIKTGKRQAVASAVAEHHIVADIAYTVVKYVKATNDQAFMQEYGKELLKETALFWLSRGVKRNGRLEILDVIGPDEYTEHIDNNAYTNYLAYYNVHHALAENLEDQEFTALCRSFLAQLYLPQPDANGLIPQDDTFLTKESIDLSKYKQVQGTQAILLDYARSEINEMQILKQADLVMLFYLQPELFTKEQVAKNLAYYEERTIHDSSLSKAIHGIELSRLGNHELSYQFFQEACLIDLGPEPHSSDDGLHAASLGAIWLGTVFGFAGVDTSGEYLALLPRLPKEWSVLTFNFVWQGETIFVYLKEDEILLKKDTMTSINLQIDGKLVLLIDEISYRRR